MAQLFQDHHPNAVALQPGHKVCTFPNDVWNGHDTKKRHTRHNCCEIHQHLHPPQLAQQPSARKCSPIPSQTSNRYRIKSSASAHQDFPPDLRRYLGWEEPRSLGGSYKAIPNEGQDEGPHGNLHGHRGPVIACGRSSLMLLQEHYENSSHAFIC
jgi:hypothetical protein